MEGSGLGGGGWVFGVGVGWITFSICMATIRVGEDYRMIRFFILKISYIRKCFNSLSA